MSITPQALNIVMSPSDNSPETLQVLWGAHEAKPYHEQSHYIQR